MCVETIGFNRAFFLVSELSEELTLQNSKDSVNDPGPILPENESDVVTFNLKYLGNNNEQRWLFCLMIDFLLEGSTIVEKVIGENISVEAVKKILKIAKTARKKLQRVNVTVSLKGIEVSDTQGNELFKISIYRISNCSTDASHRQVNNLLPPPPIKSINHFFTSFRYFPSSPPMNTRRWNATLSSVQSVKWRKRSLWLVHMPSALLTKPGGYYQRRSNSRRMSPWLMRT